MPVALVGRVPLNVTGEGGAIEVGDFVTTSSTAGKGMKANEAGRVIGMALSSFDGSGEGQIMVQVINTWYQPNQATSLQGGNNSSDMLAYGDLSVENLTVTGHLYAGADMAGRARIVTGDSRVHVSFEDEYASQPIVNATLRTATNIPGYWWIEEESTTGFDIVLDGSLTQDVEFNWIAVGVDGGKVSVSDGSSRDISVYVTDGGAPVAEEPVAEEPVAADEAAEEPAADESAPAEEPAQAEEVVAEEPVAADEAAEEPAADESAPAEEASAESPATDVAAE
jgi:hypothetical protein